MATPPRAWVRRLGWLVLLWACGVAAVALLALILRLFMGMAGLTV